MKTNVLLLLLFGIMLSCTNDDDGPVRLNSYEASIETFAGTGAFDYTGDEGPAKSAKLGYVTSVAVDASGNVYISDGAANTIRKVNAAGNIFTIAGKFEGFNVVVGDPYMGDNGPATAARLNVPISVTADPNGNVFIADAANNVLRKVDASGVITTIAGKGAQGYTGDNGPASQSLIYNPYSVATDGAGNLYFADSQNHVIRKISTSGQITTVAGMGPNHPGYSGDGGQAVAAMLSYPMGVAVDQVGNLYISDQSSVIRRIGTDGKIMTIAGKSVEGFSGDGGPATSATLSSPKGIAILADGSVVFADSSNDRIRRIVPETGIIETIAGTGQAGYSGDGGLSVDAQLSNPQGLATDANGFLYVAESGNSVIRLIKPKQ